MKARDATVKALRLGWLPFGTGLLAIARVAGSLAVTKGMATVAGPSGVALLGAFQNLTGIALAFCSAGLNSGIVKTVASAQDGLERRRIVTKFLQATTLATLFTTICVGLASGWLSRQVLGDPDLSGVVIVFAALAFGLAINTALLHALVGAGRQREFLMLNFCAAALTLIIAYPMIAAFGRIGALLVAPVANAVVVVVTLRRCYATGLLGSHARVRVDAGFLRGVSGFPVMALSSATFLPLAQLLVRDRLSEVAGRDAAGLWQGVVKVSDGYMMVVTYLVLMLVLPRFSAGTRGATSHDVVRPAAGIAILTMLMAAPLYLLRDPLISILFAPGFQPMRELFGAQMLGDVCRGVVLVVQAACAAVVATRTYVMIEFTLAAGFTLASFLLIPRMQAEGVVLGWLLAAGVTAVGAWIARPRDGRNVTVNPA